MSAKKDGNMEFDLIGIEAIEDYAEHGSPELMRWRRDFGFPMEKIQGNQWMANSGAIRKWYLERGLNPKTAKTSVLESFSIRQLWLNGKVKKLNQKLNGINAICDFVGLSIGTVYPWYKDYVGCPIKKVEGGTLECDADSLVEFIIKHKLPQQIPGFPSFQERQGAGWFYEER